YNVTERIIIELVKYLEDNYGFYIENPLNFTKQEFEFFKKYALEYKKFESRWKWMDLYPHLIPIFFREFLFPIYNRDPSVRELYNLGFGNFPNKLKEVLGVSYGKWKEEQRYYDFKKCNRCGQFLPNEEFEKKKGFEKQKRSAYRSMCRNCRNDVKRISIYDKKYRLIKNILGGKCYDCGADLTGLDGYEFHHLFQELKTATWREIKEKNYEEIVEWTIHDRVIPLCGNCHVKRTATVFLIQKELILLENLFTFSSQEIDVLIAERVEEYRDQIGSGKNQVRKWIKKRFVFLQLFFGKCVGCGKITVYNNLPALQLHHLFPELLETKHKWYDLADLDCEISMDTIMDEQCVALCSNCHSAIGSRFQELVDEIVIVGHRMLIEQHLGNFINEFEKPCRIVNQNSKIPPDVIECFNIINRKVRFNSVAGNIIKGYAASTAYKYKKHTLFVVSDSPLTTKEFIERFVHIAQKSQDQAGIILPVVLMNENKDKLDRKPLKLRND
ncbi:hypothetical protein LCGC14_2498490, partial [marine sediment metagenome]